MKSGNAAEIQERDGTPQESRKICWLKGDQIVRGGFRTLTSDDEFPAAWSFSKLAPRGMFGRPPQHRTNK
jgi:hypothetical protein